MFLRQSLALGALLGIQHVTRAQERPERTTPEPAVSRRPYVVDGADSTYPTSEYLHLLHDAGVDCWVFNGPETLTDIAAIYEFLDQHASEVAIAVSVAKIVEIRESGRLPLVI